MASQQQQQINPKKQQGVYIFECVLALQDF